MRRLLLLAADHPLIVVGLLLLVSLAAASQLPRLEITISPQALTADDDPERVFYEQTVATFGSDRITVVFLQDPALWQPEKLEAIRAAIERLEALSFVARTQSLFSIPNLRTVDKFVYTDPYLDRLPRDAEEAAAIRAAALENPFVRDNLLSRDGTAMAVNVFLSDDGRDPRFDAPAVAAIEAALAPLRSEIEQVFQMGSPYIRTTIAEHIRHDQRTVIPMAVAVLAVTLLLTLRRPAGALIPLLTAGLSVLWTLGLMAALGISVNVLTAIVPVLLIIIGSTEDVHLISEYYEGTLAGRSRNAAVRRMAARLGLTILLTFTTTYLGFLSIAANSIELLREFGVVASTGLLFNFLITATLVPVVLRYLGDRPRTALGDRKPLQGLAAAIHVAVTRRPRTLGAVAVLVGAVSALGALSVEVNNNILNYFRADSPIRERAQTLHEELAGMQTFSVVVDGRINETFLKPYYLRELIEIQDFLAGDPQIDFTVSFADYMMLLNSAANDTGELELPETDDILRELTLFVRRDNVREYISADYSAASIVVRHNITASQELRALRERLERFVAEHTDSGLDVRVTGQTILADNAADRMAAGQARSLGLMLLVIFVIISALFVNPRVGLLALLPNAFPILVLFGVMGYAGIPLDTGTAMIAAIAIGICVDNTMHFMVRYNRELRSRVSERAAIAETLRAETLPITATSLAMAFGLAVLAFSSFTPVMYFGLLSGMVMLLALYADFFITPVALATTRLITLWELLSLDLRRLLVRDCELFRGMRPSQIKRVALLGKLREVRPGTTVMTCGDPSQEMYVLLRGRLELRSPSAGTKAAARRPIDPGGVFGVVALLSGRPRIATVTALEDSLVLSLDWPRIRRIARLYPFLGALLYGNLAEMLARRFAENAFVDDCTREPRTGPGGGRQARTPATLAPPGAAVSFHPLSAVDADPPG